MKPYIENSKNVISFIYKLDMQENETTHRSSLICYIFASTKDMKENETTRMPSYIYYILVNKKNIILDENIHVLT
jgi:hypothetical protein